LPSPPGPARARSRSDRRAQSEVDRAGWTQQRAREVTGGRYVPRSRLWTSPPRRSRALPRDADSCVCACSLADGGSSGRGPGGARRQRALSRKDQVGDFSDAILMGKKKVLSGSHPSVPIQPAPSHTRPADSRPGGSTEKSRVGGNVPQARDGAKSGASSFSAARRRPPPHAADALDGRVPAERLPAPRVLRAR